MSKPTARRFGYTLGLKAFVIVVLALLLLIPLWMVGSVISERNYRAKEVAREIAGKWAFNQSVQGPFLVIPGERTDPASEQGETQYRKAVLLPDAFSARAEVETETRSRGIFDTVVYTTKVTLTGDFTAEALERAGFDEDGWRLRPDQAVLALGINDLRGLQGDMVMTWNGTALDAEPGTPSGAQLPLSGVHWAVETLGSPDSEGHHFDMIFTLRGSSRLSFVPVGKSSALEMSSDWPSPSFNGPTLPVEHSVGDDGFSARWDVFHLSRSLPQSWTSMEVPGIDWGRLAVGASFLQPVDFYLLSERSVKYGLLIVALLFLTFFLFEVLAGIALHALQYLMVGAGLVLFFLSLVALAEVLGFALAFGLSSCLVAAMIGLYAGAILKRRRWAVSLCAMILSLYALIYLILNLEEAALLAGTVVLFAALGLTMYVTRHVDWYNVKKLPSSNDAPPASGEAAL
jgi:inner membrane protein